MRTRTWLRLWNFKYDRLDSFLSTMLDTSVDLVIQDTPGRKEPQLLEKTNPLTIWGTYMYHYEFISDQELSKYAEPPDEVCFKDAKFLGKYNLHIFSLCTPSRIDGATLALAPTRHLTHGENNIIHQMFSELELVF